MNGLKISLLVLSSVLFSGQVSAKEQLLDSVAAIVDGDVVLESEISNLIQSVKRSSRHANQALPDDETLRKQSMERLITESLQLQLAERMGVKISDSQLEETISNVAEQEGKTREAYLADLLSDGVSYATYREQVRKELILGQVRQAQVRRRINISDQEVDALVELIKEQGEKQAQYHVGHILLKVSGQAASSELEQVKKRAVAIIEQLQAGEDFHQLALTESQGPKALEGGDWGWMNINEMPSLFSEVVQDKEQGEVFGPLRTASGFHIIKVLGTKGVQNVEQVEVNARHILIKPSIILSDKKAKSILEGFLTQIASGDATFEALAEQYSEDPGSAIRGGSLGWATPDTYVPAFRDQVEKLEPGEVSKPFRSTFGWHVIKLDDKRVTDATQSAIRNQAYQLLFRRKFAEETEIWLAELREEAYIQRLDDKKEQTETK